MMHTIKTKAADKDGAATVDIVDAEYAKQPAFVKSDLLKMKTLKRQAKRIRNAAIGKIKRAKPKEFKNVELPDSVKFMDDEEGNPTVEFVAWDSGHLDPNRAVLMCPKENLKKLAKCSQVNSDGTFCVPKGAGFKQVCIQTRINVCFKTTVNCPCLFLKQNLGK